MREVCLGCNGWLMMGVGKVEVSMIGGIDMGFYVLCDYFCEMEGALVCFHGFCMLMCIWQCK